MLVKRNLKLLLVAGSLSIALTALSGRLPAQTHSDVYLKTDSLIRYELKFDLDSASKVVQQVASSITAFPLILLDDKSVTMKELDHFKLTDIQRS